jgi:hypothetical protein
MKHSKTLIRTNNVSLGNKRREILHAKSEFNSESEHKLVNVMSFEYMSAVKYFGT